MGYRRAIGALTVLLLVSGLSAQGNKPWHNQALEDPSDLLPIDVLSLQSAEDSEDPCSIPGYGTFGEYDAAAAAAAAAGALGYGPSVGTYGAAAAPAAATAAEFMRSKGCTPLTMPGRLLGVGGISNCQGTFTPLAPELSPLASKTLTDPMGRFKQSTATLGLYTWNASSSSSSSNCVDRVTGVPLSYNWQLVALAFDLLIVTDLALLTMPAAKGLTPVQQGSGEVFDRVYKAFGVDAGKLQIDMITYENVTSASPVWPALMGINAQLSFVSHAAAHTIYRIKQGPSAAPQQQQQQQLSDVVGIQESLWKVVTEMAEGDGAGMLTTRSLVREVLSEVARRNNLPNWETSSARGQEVLLDSIARIIATSNHELLKPIVDTAMSCATSALAGMPRLSPDCSAASLAASVASVATVQKTNMTDDILTLVKAYVATGNPLKTPSTLPEIDPSEDPDRAPAPSPSSSSSTTAGAAAYADGPLDGTDDDTAEPKAENASAVITPAAGFQRNQDEAEKRKREAEEEEEWSPTPKKRKGPIAKAMSTARARREAFKKQQKCLKQYDPELCQHDLRPQCDYGRYRGGAYPPDDCHPFKTYALSKAKAFIRAAAAHMDGELPVDSVEPDGTTEVPKRRKGLLGLLSFMGTALLGVLGVVGIIPAGNLLANSIAPLPLGTIIILPGLVLAPMHSPLSAVQSKGIMPWSFGGNCGPFGGHLPLEKIQGTTPSDILRIIPQNTCLPRGWLYKLSNMTDAGFSPKLSKLPASTIVFKNDMIYVPQQGGSTIKSLAKSLPGIETTEWTTPNTAASESSAFKVVEADGRHYFIISEDVKTRARMANSNATAPNPEDNKRAGRGLVHGSAECIKQGPPPASCPTSGPLRPAGLLPNIPAKAQAPTQLQATAVAVGYVQGCAGDYYSYSELAPAVEDVQKLNMDRRFASVFKSFTTGGDEKAVQSWGSFGVGNVTGRGHAFLTNAWACPETVPEDAPVCVDGWTGVQIKVPIGGLVPYPKDHKRDKGANVDVVMSPLSMATMVDVNASATVADAYSDAFKSAEVKFNGNAMLADPVRLLRSGKTPQVKQGVALMVENAKVLNTLTTARALYECRSGSSAELSNELFVEWAGKLVQQAPMTKPGPLKAALRDLCLQGTCSDNAAGALLMLNKYLGLIKAKYEALPKEAPVPLSLVDDLVKLAQLSHVGQAELYESVRSCCGLTGATSAGPLDDFVQRMEDLTAMASIKHSAIHAAATMALGGGVEAHSSSSSSGSGVGSEPVTDSLESATTSMVGTLLNNGGVRDCKGILYPQVEGETPLALLTDSQGQFIVDDPLDGIYKFSSAIAGSACIDTLTGVPVTFPMIQQIPATMAATVTAISLLSGPAKSDPAVRQLVSVNGQVSPELLVNYVYNLYGLNAEELDVDFFSFTGQALQLGSPRLAQVSGAIAQTMATYTAGHAMLTALFAGKASSDQIAQCIVAATYKKIAQHGNAITTLTDKVAIAAIYKAAYTQCAPPSRRRALLSAEPAKFPSSNPADDAYAGIAAAFKAANPDSSNSSLTDDIWEQLATAMAAAENTTALEDAGADAMPAASQAAVGIAVVPAAPKAERKTASEASVGVAAISPSGVDAAVDGPAAAAAAAAAPKSANEVDDLFAAAARVLAVSNQRIQQAVVQADRAASTYKAKAPFSVSSALTNISSVAAVQQADFAATVGVLAGTVAADIEQQSDGMDSRELQRGLFQTQVTDLEDAYTGDSLDNRIEAKAASITAAAVSKGLANVGQTLVVDDDGRVGVFVPGKPKPKATIHPGIIAGAAVGGVLLLGALATLIICLVRRRRKAVASGPFAPTDIGGAPDTPTIAGGRKLKLIGRRSNGTDNDSEASTPHSTAGPVAEAVLTPNNSNGGNVLLMNTNPLYGTPQSPRPGAAVRASVGDLRELQ